MLYWVIIGILIAAIIAVIFFTISKLLKEKKDYNQFERRYHSEDDYDDDYDDEEDDEEEEDDYEPEPRCRPVREQAVHLLPRRRDAGRSFWKMWISRISIVLFFMIRWESEGSVHRQSMTSFCPCRKI